MKKKRDGTSRPSAPIGPRRSRRLISTRARSRSTAARTKFRRTSSRRRYWDCSTPNNLILTSAAKQRVSKDVQIHGASRRAPLREALLSMRTTKEWISTSPKNRLLKESVDRFISDRYDFEQRKTFAQGDSGYSSENWKQFAELGLLAIPFAEEHGGFGGGPVETMIVMEAFGR